MNELLYLILFLGAFGLYVSVVIPVAFIIYHKAIRRDGKTVKQILDELNF